MLVKYICILQRFLNFMKILQNLYYIIDNKIVEKMFKFPVNDYRVDKITYNFIYI